MTANQALNELDKFPAFRAELEKLLESGQLLSRVPNDYMMAGICASKAARLGAMIELRDAMERPS